MTYRVIQYATGITGSLTLKTLSERSDMQLVGLGCTSPGKVGKDAGEITGGAMTGIKATNDLDALCGLDADVVLHMPLPSALMGSGPRMDQDVICKFLEAGKNVITTVGYMYPKAYGPEVVDRLEAACAKGRSSLHGTGYNPGFVSDVIPATLLSMSARVDRVFVQDITDFATHPSWSFVHNYLGMGMTPEQFEARTKYNAYANALFSESVHLLADTLGAKVEDITPSLEYHVATEDISVASGVVPKGTVSAHCGRWLGVVGGKTLIDIWLIYRARGDQGLQWGGTARPFLFQIDGRPKFKVELDHDWCSSGLWGTAGHAVNAIPHVVAAAPGIQTFLDLPMIRAMGAVRSR